MPEFAPSEAKIARAPITVRPSGLSCEAEAFLGPNELTKVATSGLVPFTSTGASQNVRLPVIMPLAEGTYHVYIDVYIEGILIAAYKALEDVVIVPIAPIIAGEIIESYWRLTTEAIQHPHSDPIPYQAGYYMCFKIRNKGNTTTSFRMAYYVPPPQYGAGWRYSKPITLSPGEEGLIEWVFWAGDLKGAYTLTWYLFGDDTQVDSITITNYFSGK